MESGSAHFGRPGWGRNQCHRGGWLGYYGTGHDIPGGAGAHRQWHQSAPHRGAKYQCLRYLYAAWVTEKQDDFFSLSVRNTWRRYWRYRRSKDTRGDLQYRTRGRYGFGISDDVEWYRCESSDRCQRSFPTPTDLGPHTDGARRLLGRLYSDRDGVCAVTDSQQSAGAGPRDG